MPTPSAMVTQDEGSASSSTAILVSAVLQLKSANIKPSPRWRIHVASWAAMVQMAPVHTTPQHFIENQAKTRHLAFVQFSSIDDRVVFKAGC